MFLVATTTNTQTICSIVQHFYLHYSLSLIYSLFNLYVEQECDANCTKQQCSIPRMNRESFLGGGPDSPDPTPCEA